MKEKMRKLGVKVRQLCSADDFTLTMYYNQDTHVRFAQNGITQHIDGENLVLNLEVAFDDQTGTASINQIDEESIEMLVHNAEAIALLNMPDPEYIGTDGARKLRPLNKQAEATVNLDVKEMVDGIELCVNNAIEKEAKVSGISDKHIYKNYMMTKKGFQGYDERVLFSHSMTMKKEGVETKVSASVQDYSQFSMDQMIQQLNEQFDSLKEPQKIEKGRMPVIMRPQAFLQWLRYLAWTFQLREAEEGTSPYTDQLGKQFFGEKFNLYSTVDNPILSAPLFTRDGTPTKNISWIENGNIVNMQCDRFYAKLKGIEPAMMFNTVVDGGDDTEKEMMSKVKRGVILNNLWYIRPVDMKAGEWTGLTRDGVLYFEDGEVKHSVTNFRWNEILHDATKRILGLGKAVQVEHNAIVPTVLFDDFNFVDVTTF